MWSVLAVINFVAGVLKWAYRAGDRIERRISKKFGGVQPGYSIFDWRVRSVTLERMRFDTKVIKNFASISMLLALYFINVGVNDGDRHLTLIAFFMLFMMPPLVVIQTCRLSDRERYEQLEAARREAYFRSWV
ncbi:hypothetical protein RJ527_06070 [Thalassospiraceae bacterium LMO-SO8]|nr:hypothetical protein [Alphaproteobacteria bacterium LMO-S08]WND77306.1 hypothetical protein RJ527_06070 [Thalassospiraceae bacterium LMO-SO8]